MTTFMELFPDIAQELVRILKASNRQWLVDSVPELKVVDRCRCEDDSCATVYTVPPPKKFWGPGLRNYHLDTDDGSIIILDVVRGRIACVEILFRKGAPERLLAVCP